MTRVLEWRPGAIPRLRCPECEHASLYVCHVWYLTDDGVSLAYAWCCRQPGCPFVTVDSDRTLLMGLNDEREKLRQAEEWLASAPSFSDRFRAAYDHVTWVYVHATDLDLDHEARWGLRDEAARIIGEVLGFDLPGRDTPL